MHLRGPGIEEPLGALIVDGRRHEVSVRSEPDEDGIWHNALLFRRDAAFAPPSVLAVGLPWHVPPGYALRRAEALAPAERLELFRQADPTRLPA